MLFCAVSPVTNLQVMKGIDHLNILVGTSQMLAVVFAPIWFVYEGQNIMFGDALADKSMVEVRANLLALGFVGLPGSIKHGLLGRGYVA